MSSTQATTTVPANQTSSPLSQTIDPGTVVLEANAESSQATDRTSRMPATDLIRRQMSHCGEYTFQALNKIGKLSPEDTSKVTQKYLKAVQSVPKGQPFPDAIHFLVTEGWQKDEIDILSMTKSLLRYTKTKISHIAFAHQNETPIEFYNDYPAISEICRLMSAPIIQVSEKDFFTVTSINPFTGTAAARLVLNEIEAEVGKKAFYFVTTTDLNAWKYTCKRHFGT